MHLYRPSIHLWLFTGQLLLAKGEVDQASSAFKIVLDGDRDNVPALLGQVVFLCQKESNLVLICFFLSEIKWGNFNTIPVFFFPHISKGQT